MPEKQNYDLHCHMLFGVDDGAGDAQTMQEMIDLAWRDGTEAICFTPHYHPGYYGTNTERSELAFEAASAYAAERYPKLKLSLGNELHYDSGAPEWLRTGAAKTLCGSRYVLVDFHDDEAAFTIDRAMTQILSLGYTPVLAHVERYRNLHGRLHDVEAMMTRGVLMQLDAQSVMGEFGIHTRRMVRAMLKSGLADLVCSDAHDTSTRPPLLTPCRQLIEKKYGQAYAELLFRQNPALIWEDRKVR